MSTEKAKSYITLALRAGPVPAAEMLSEAEKFGIAPTTLKRAKAELEVESVKRGDTWVWTRPGQEAKQGDQEDHTAPEDAATSADMPNTMYAFDVQTGGMVPHSEVLKRKGWENGLK